MDPCVTLVALRGADYSDAITVADVIAQHQDFFPEGGVRNISRRDRLGTTMLAAVEKMVYLPGYYFQAVGSGAGAISAFEASKRLVGDGRFGSVLPRLMLQLEWLDTPPVQPTLTLGIEGPRFEPPIDRIINSMQGKAFA